MAFGDSMKNTRGAGTGSTEDFINPWIDPLRGIYRTGRRVFRILPHTTPAGMVMQDEVPFAEYWIPVMKQGQQRQQRVMVDPYKPFSNPIWERLYHDLPREVNGKPNRDRVLAKQRFALNVLDKTKVIKLPNNKFAYPSENGQYYTEVNGTTTKLDGTPSPLLQVRILEGSNGKPGGKHMLQGLNDLVGSVTAPDNEDRVLQLYEFDIALRVTGEGTDTRRTFQVAGDFRPLAEEYINLPRYDLKSWVKPWPHSVINALLDGEDFDEVMKDSGIVLFPQLEGEVEEDSE